MYTLELLKFFGVLFVTWTCTCALAFILAVILFTFIVDENITNAKTARNNFTKNSLDCMLNNKTIYELDIEYWTTLATLTTHEEKTKLTDLYVEKYRVATIQSIASDNFLNDDKTQTIKTFDPNYKDVYGLYFLDYVLCMYNSSKHVELLINSGALPTNVNDKGIQPVTYIAKMCNVDTMKFWLDKGFCIETTKPSNNIFYNAIVSNCNVSLKQKYDFIKFLVENNVNPKFEEFKEYQNFPAVFIVDSCIVRYSLSEIDYKHAIDIIELLKQIGLDINETDTYGNTVLHSASQNQNQHKIKFWIKNGINLEIKNNKNKDAEDYAETPNTINLFNRKRLETIRNFLDKQSGEIVSLKAEVQKLEQGMLIEC